MLGALSFSAKDRVLLVLPLHHAMPFMATVVLPLLVGAETVIENDMHRMRDRLQSHPPTVFFGVPALYEIMYRSILSRAEAEGRLTQLLRWQAVVRRIKQVTGVNLGPLIFRRLHKSLGGRLRFLVSGGAALNPTTALDFMSLGLPLLQGWGMSEASPVVALQRFSPWRFLFTRHYERLAGSVGQAVPGVTVRLADVPEKGVSVARQGEGEVLAKGPNVFQGYWQSPETTAAAIRDGWLHTGDLGRIDGDGNIYLTGRIKDIILLESGEKLLPDEIEATLSQSSLIEEACIIGRTVRDKTIVIAVVYASRDAFARRCLERGVRADEASLRAEVRGEIEACCRQLAAYKRVSRVELADAPLPKTPLQKIARARMAQSESFSFESWLKGHEAE